MITLKKAVPSNCIEIQKMQEEAFRALLDKYQDMETNPGAENIEKIIGRMEQDHTDYYFIVLDNKENIGAIRVVRQNNGVNKIAPMFILPKFQGKGYAQKTITLAEQKYPNITQWELDTIKQEVKLCHLYEKMGYKATGKEEIIKNGMTLVFYKKSINQNTKTN